MSDNYNLKNFLLKHILEKKISHTGASSEVARQREPNPFLKTRFYPINTCISLSFLLQS